MTRHDSGVEWGDWHRPLVDAVPPVVWLLAWGVFVSLVVYVALARGGR
jgi:hypothetical protein